MSLILKKNIEGNLEILKENKFLKSEVYSIEFDKKSRDWCIYHGLYGCMKNIYRL